MPSGPKKRKTAKKKKEKEEKPNSEGIDEGELKDDKGSDSCDSISFYDAKHVSPKHVEFIKRSVDRSSSRESSDDDFRVSEAKLEDEDPFLRTNSDEQPGDSFDLIVQTSSVLHSIPAEIPASEEAIATAENASTQNSVIADVITSNVDETAENHEQKSSPPSSNGVTEIPKSYENKKPLVAEARQAMQKTSFLSCCGLFDTVSSSDR